MNEINESKSDTALSFQIFWKVKVIVLVFILFIYEVHHYLLSKFNRNVPYHQSGLLQHFFIAVFLSIQYPFEINLIVFRPYQHFLFRSFLRLLVSKIVFFDYQFVSFASIFCCFGGLMFCFFDVLFFNLAKITCLFPENVGLRLKLLLTLLNLLIWIHVLRWLYLKLIWLLILLLIRKLNSTRVIVIVVIIARKLHWLLLLLALKHSRLSCWLILHWLHSIRIWRQIGWINLWYHLALKVVRKKLLLSLHELLVLVELL